ncbi:phosphotransferase family protein [Nocardioides plantarum]|uniref:Phosphotransferase family protein n=1 Tax=Nocardioides plantarum TaxID=29299 RepID=A0ABV5KDN7_9ACTN|nr:phosphotransferase [Nocardioides plantarum]
MTDFASLEPLEGGWSGETFVARVGEGSAAERQVVRIHVRDPDRAAVDAALLRLVRGLVPVAEVLEVRPAVGGMPALLVTSFLPGVRGDLLLPDLDDAGLVAVGRQVGDLVATLGGMPLVRPGRFVGPDLAIEPWDLPDGLPGWVETHLPALAHWSYDEKAALGDLAADAQELLDTVARTCLVHSDLNPKNLLLDPTTLEVTALLDWEFAHAGHPFTDLGNVLRFEGDGPWQPYADAVLAAYHERRGTPPGEARALARAADLWALVDLAARRGANPVAERADDLLRAMVRSFDTVVPGA